MTASAKPFALQIQAFEGPYYFSRFKGKLLVAFPKYSKPRDVDAMKWRETVVSAASVEVLNWC